MNHLTAALARLAIAATPIAVAVALAACSSTPIATAPSGPAPVVTATPTPVSPSAATTPLAPSATQATPLGATGGPDADVLRKNSVYFAYDDANFRVEDKPVVELQARYLNQHAQAKVMIAGNTDERGGSEYNLALGQRRAQSVKSALELLGVKEAQVEAVSYGKEKPVATGHDEAAHAQNRRADFIYPMH
jgi:peptidoglycan-associated lipoprotein